MSRGNTAKLTVGLLVQVKSMPGVAYMVDDTPAPEGYVWLRPSHVALIVPVGEVEEWAPGAGKHPVLDKQP